MNQIIKDTFATNLKTLRCSFRMTVDELAEALGWSKKAKIEDLESGNLEPTLDEAIEITEYFSVDIDNMLYRNCKLNSEWQ